MSITRRQFNRMLIWGGASFTASATSGIFFPKPAEAYSLEFSLSDLSANKVFRGFQRYCGAESIPGVLSGILQGNKNVSSKIDADGVKQIRTADRAFVNRNFTKNRTELAVTGSGAIHASDTSRLWGRQRQDNLGPNVGFGFVQKHNDQWTDHKISGPTMCAIYNAQLVLADQRLTPPEIAASVLPTRASTVNDWGVWDGDSDGPVGTNPAVAFTEYETSAGTITSRYEVIKPGRGGFGRIEFIVDAAVRDQPLRRILVTVRF